MRQTDFISCLLNGTEIQQFALKKTIWTSRCVGRERGREGGMLGGPCNNSCAGHCSKFEKHTHVISSNFHHSLLRYYYYRNWDTVICMLLQLKKFRYKKLICAQPVWLSGWAWTQEPRGHGFPVRAHAGLQAWSQWGACRTQIIDVPLVDVSIFLFLSLPLSLSLQNQFKKPKHIKEEIDLPAVSQLRSGSGGIPAPLCHVLPHFG